MGNTNTKESGSGSGPRGHRPSLTPEASSSSHRSGRPSSRSGRTTRTDLGGLLGLTHSTSSNQPTQEQQRRETKQEREARRLEKERQARLAEREKSIKEEHVDGGYLVTLGTYVGPEDFSKQVVRQLQIERRIAPFWRGLQDFDDNWTEPQIIAAARGIDIPPAGETPPDELVPKPLALDSPSTSTQNLNSLTVPMGPRSQSAASDKSVTNLGSTIPSPTTGPPRGSSPFKPRAKALAAALSVGSRNASQTEIGPREINLPADPFVNGQPTEVFLYKSGSECPICFLYYPPYLNHTRCCDQPICSECFVQIKRPDPHYPEGHGDNPENENANPEEQAGQLISEPACCPYCQQPEFGVTYEPPPFRRGLTYSAGSLTVGLHGTAFSSSSSLNSNNLSPSSLNSPGAGNRRRTQSLSATAPNVITTDRVRPDWSTKLANQRAHIARRAAAATALHTAAFLIGNNSESRSGFRVSRFGRRTGQSSSPGGRVDEGSPQGNTSEAGEGDGASGTDTARPLGAGGRRNRMEDLEELMFREALRQSLASEEERQRKWEKELRKEAKKREKEERKAAKAALKHGSGPYSQSGSGQSSATASSLSLSGLVHGRRRGNSAASNLRVEASVASASAVDVSGSGSASPVNTTDKGKAIDRPPTVPEARTSEEAGESSRTAATSSTMSGSATTSARPVPTPHQPAGPSHLRQMSSASSVTSSLPDSTPNSFTPQSHLQDPKSSGLTLGGASEDGENADDNDPSNSAEPMFNFSSLAEMVGVQLEGEHAGRRLSAIGRDSLVGGNADGETGEGTATSPGQHADKDDEASAAHQEHVEDAGSGDIEQSIATLKLSDVKHFKAESEKEAGTTSSSLAPPQLMITPETPAPIDEDGDESKRLGFEATTIENSGTVTQ